MSARRLLTGSTLALLLPVSLLVGSGSSSAADDVEAPTASVSVRVKPAQRVRLEALPQIVQHGGEVADSGAAKAAVTATLRPVRVGRRVELQHLAHPVDVGVAEAPVAGRRALARGEAEPVLPGPQDRGGQAGAGRQHADAEPLGRSLRHDASLPLRLMLN